MSSTLSNIILNDYSSKYVLVLDDRAYYPNVQSTQEDILFEKRYLSDPEFFQGMPGTPSQVDPFRQCIGAIWTYKSLSPNTNPKQMTFFKSTADITRGDNALPTQYSDTIATKNGYAPTGIEFEDVSDQWAKFFGKGSYNQTLNLPRKATRLKVFVQEGGNPFENQTYQGDQSDLYIAAAALNLITPMNKKRGAPLVSLGTYGFQLSATDPDEVFKESASSQIGYYGHLNRIEPMDLQYATENGSGPIKKLWKLKQNSNESVYENARGIWESYLKDLCSYTIKYNRFDRFYDPVNDTYMYDRLFYQSSEFSMDLPNSILAQETSNEENKSSLYVDIRSEYNYYSKLYEKSTTLDTYETFEGTQAEVDEKQLPNIYEVPLSEDPDGTPDPDADLYVSGQNQYDFEKMGYKLLNCEYYPNNSEIKYNSNIIIYQNNKQFLDKYDNIKTQFPFYVNLEFKTEPKKQFTTIFNNYGMTNKIISMIISNNLNADEQDGFISTIDPDKSAPIKGNRTYYDPFDIIGEYRDKDDLTAPICLDEIYKIVDKRHAYKLMTPSFYSNKSQQLLEEPVKLDASYLTREYDLNRWFDGYLKHLTTLTPSPIAETSPGGINYDAWNELVTGLGAAATYSKVFKDQDEELFGGNGDFFDIINASIFTEKYRSLVNEKARTYEDIISLQGTEAGSTGAVMDDVTSVGAYNETLFYRVQKTSLSDSGVPDSKGVVQNIWIVRPNDEEDSSEIMKYIDTQVKYNKNYEYKIYAYQLVVGTKYGFQFTNKYHLGGDVTAAPGGFTSTGLLAKLSDFNQGIEASINNTSAASINGPQYITAEGSQAVLHKNTDEYTNEAGDKYQLTAESLVYRGEDNQTPNSLLMFDVICEPDVKLVEIPFYSKKVAVADAPPVAPEADIIPLRGEKNKIKINFLPSTVNQEIVPYIIEGKEDADSFSRIRKSQGRDLLKIKFAEYFEAGLSTEQYFKPIFLLKA